VSPPTGGRVANKPKDGIHSWGIRLISNALSGLLSIADITRKDKRCRYMKICFGPLTRFGLAEMGNAEG